MQSTLFYHVCLHLNERTDYNMQIAVAVILQRFDLLVLVHAFFSRYIARFMTSRFWYLTSSRALIWNQSIAAAGCASVQSERCL